MVPLWMEWKPSLFFLISFPGIVPTAVRLRGGRGDGLQEVDRRAQVRGRHPQVALRQDPQEGPRQHLRRIELTDTILIISIFTISMTKTDTPSPGCTDVLFKL